MIDATNFDLITATDSSLADICLLAAKAIRAMEELSQAIERERARRANLAEAK